MRKTITDNPLHGEKLYSALINSLRAIVWEADPQTFQFSFVSPHAERILGYPSCQWVEEPNFWYAHTHPDDAGRSADFCRESVAKGIDHDFQYRMIAADGRVVWMHDIVTLVRLSDGALRLRGIMIDISETKATEAKLRSSEERFQLAMQGTQDGLWDWNLLTDETYFSPGWKAMLGYAEEELADHLDTWAKAVHPDDRDQVLALVQDYIAGRVEKYETEFRMHHKDGHYVTVLSRGVLSRDARGKAVRMVGTHVDITERRRAEEELRLKSFTIDNLSDEIIWTTPECRIWKVNDFACEKLGYSCDELLALTVSDIDPDFTKDACRTHWGKIEAAGSLCFESRHKTKDGRIYPVEVTANRFNHDGLEYNCSIIRDISERKKLEQALRDSEEQFRTLCDFAPIGIFRSDQDGNNTYMNRRWEDITGISVSQGMNEGLVGSVHPEDRAGIVTVWNEAVAAGSSFSHECRILTPQNKCKWIRALGSPLKGQHGAVIGYVGTVEDITELQQARQEILKIQKLESLGLMAGGIAHDFNNILTAVLGNISLAQYQLHDPEKLSKRLEDAEKATSRARDLTQQLLTFAKGGVPIKSAIDLRGLLKEASDFALHGSSVRCLYDLAQDLWPVEADEGQLIQVVQNLVLNAVQAMPDGGTVTVSAKNVTSRENRRFVKVSFADTGIGIPEAHLQKIFDPYFTTKQQGSGLGLATCFSIISKHDGKIRVTSTLGEGSTFVVSIPAAEGVCRISPPAQSVDHRGCGRILVMDDESGVREIVKSMLEEFGYSADCVENGAEAIELYRQMKLLGRPFSAVILDLTIPGGAGGKDVIKKLLEVDPEVKAVVSSGYSNDPVMANFRHYGFKAVLKKPFLPREMNSVLRDLLR